MQPATTASSRKDRKASARKPSNGTETPLEPRTIHELVEEHRRFLATLPHDLEDVDLPPDND